MPQLVVICAFFRVSADYMIGRADTTCGLSPDQWIVDEDAEAARRADGKAKVRVMVKVPRRPRVISHEESEQLRSELRLDKL